MMDQYRNQMRMKQKLVKWTYFRDQIKNGKGEGMIFFRDPHISRTWHFREAHITRGFRYPYIPKIAFSGPSHKKWQFHDPHIQKVAFSRPPLRRIMHMLSIRTNKNRSYAKYSLYIRNSNKHKRYTNCNEIEINFLQFKK